MDTFITFGFVRVAVITPELRVADVAYNTDSIINALEISRKMHCQLAVLPELGVSGYSCGDLFYQPLLLSSALASLETIAKKTEDLDIAAAVGLPLVWDGRLYNCVAFINRGRVLGIVPKTYLPTTNEFYEERWFTSAKEIGNDSITLFKQEIPFGTDLIFRSTNLPSCVIGIEICEDLWAVQPLSGEQALAGATILTNSSASNELLGKANYRRDLVKQQSARCMAAYLYAGSGPGESTTDVVFGGHSLIAENGIMLAETERFLFDTQILVKDIDCQRLINERLKNSSFSKIKSQRRFRTINFMMPEPAHLKSSSVELFRPVTHSPFVPQDVSLRSQHCKEIFSIQATGLVKRIRHTSLKCAVIGISGGLDSTLALLVTVKAFDQLEISRKEIIAVTMPGFGTSERTRTNAIRLAEYLGVTLKSIPIHDVVSQHLKDIEHDEMSMDVVYENAQARERTQILMDVANQNNGLVIGTGDLSELALGWCTYNGDQMSMYNVNAGVPKTLVRYMVDWVAESEHGGQIADVLHDISATPISPELLPLPGRDERSQLTEATIGPYELHDFFLYNIIRHQFSPKKTYFLACRAFGNDYPPSEILQWLKVFYQRFFASQFKRSAMPDGPKVGSVALSPRGDWRMPSDAEASLWVEEVDSLFKEYGSC